MQRIAAFSEVEWSIASKKGIPMAMPGCDGKREDKGETKDKVENENRPIFDLVWRGSSR